MLSVQTIEASVMYFHNCSFLHISVALVQPYCVFQMRIPAGANIAIDLW